MSSKHTTKFKLTDNQLAAILASVTVISFFIIYWTIQIISVQQVLEMVYG